MKRFYTIIVVVILTAVGMIVWDKISQPSSDQSKVLEYLDSMAKQQALMYSKIDSLDRLRHEEFVRYEQINLKYDTIQIAIDTMPDIDGTKLLLTISRQLTAKGVE